MIKQTIYKIVYKNWKKYFDLEVIINEQGVIFNFFFNCILLKIRFAHKFYKYISTNWDIAMET